MGRQIVMRPEMLHLKRLRSKWASASSTGRLTFNTDLLREPSDFRMEVIVHELLHLKVPNHGKVFKALLKAYCAEPKPGMRG
jgi:predicted metal-dependent hydrolase